MYHRGFGFFPEIESVLIVKVNKLGALDITLNIIQEKNLTPPLL